MAKRWVLDTDTKGTGAEMVPLEKVLKAPATARRTVPQSTKPRPASPPPKPREPRRFKVVDVMTREVLAEGVGVRRTLELLGAFRSPVDLSLYVWDPDDERWRRLFADERRVLWEAARSR